MKWTTTAASFAESFVFLIPLAFLLRTISDVLFFAAFPLSSALVLIICAFLCHQRLTAIMDGEKVMGSWECQLRPKDGVFMSEELMNFSTRCGLSNRVAYRLGLCAEELVAHVRKQRAQVMVDLFVRIYRDHATLVAIDNGKDEFLIHTLMEDDDTPFMNNAYILKKISTEYNYRVLFDLNVSSLNLDFQEESLSVSSDQKERET